MCSVHNWCIRLTSNLYTLFINAELVRVVLLDYHYWRAPGPLGSFNHAFAFHFFYLGVNNCLHYRVSGAVSLFNRLVGFQPDAILNSVGRPLDILKLPKLGGQELL